MVHSLWEWKASQVFPIIFLVLLLPPNWDLGTWPEKISSSTFGTNVDDQKKIPVFQVPITYERFVCTAWKSASVSTVCPAEHRHRWWSRRFGPDNGLLGFADPQGDVFQKVAKWHPPPHLLSICRYGTAARAGVTPNDFILAAKLNHMDVAMPSFSPPIFQISTNYPSIKFS